MAITPSFAIGDTVELRDACFDTVGTVVAIIRPGHVKVEWNTGTGYMGKTTMLSVRVLRKRRDGGAPEGGPRGTDTR